MSVNLKREAQMLR